MILEKDLQKSFCNQLKKNGYQYLGSHLKVEDLEFNFRKLVEDFNKTVFSDSEFNRLRTKMTVSMGEAFDLLRTGVLIVRDDNTNFTVKLFDPHNLDNNVYQVTEELKIDGVRDRRLDVILLLNGIPVVAVELKAPGSPKGAQAAISDINTYTREGIYRVGLLKFVQFYIASDNLTTKYFSTSIKTEQGDGYKTGFYWTDPKNVRLLELTNNTQNVTNTMLTKEMLTQLVWSYMLKTPAPDNNILILRPYQIYAVKDGVKRAISTNDNGFFWHATGSGKTLTSYIFAKTLKEHPKFEKTILLLDRNDLADQTISEYQKFGLPNTQTVVKSRQLKTALQDDSTRLIITTIQSFDRLTQKYTKSLKKSHAKSACFIIDECHRSTFGSMFKTIKNTYRKAQFFGYTGTPRLAENATANDILTKDIFGEPVHIYTTKNAIDDRNVLAFELHEVALEHSQPDVEKDSKYFLDSNRISEISKYITTNFWKHTAQKYPVKNTDYLNGYTAMLAAPNIAAAYKYWQQLTPALKAQGRTTAIVFSISNKTEETVPGEGTPETWYPEILKEYDNAYGTNFIGTYNTYGQSETRKQHLTDVMARVKNKEIDLVIVSDMLLTGFDAPTLNTLYMDKGQKYHNLLQAMSRTNRLHTSNGVEKQTGNVIIFSDSDMIPDVNDTIALYSNNENVEGVVLRRNYRELYNTVVDQILELKNTYPNPLDINSIDEIKELIKLASFYSGLNSNLTRLQTYDQWETTSWNTLPVKEQELHEYYASIVNKKEDFGLKHSNTEDDEWLQLEFAISGISKATIDAAYINDLLRKGIYSPEKDKKKWFNQVVKAVNLSDDPEVIKAKPAFLKVAENYKQIQNETQLWDTINHFKAIELKNKYDSFSRVSNIPVNILEHYVHLYERTETIPVGEIDTMLREQGKGLRDRRIIRENLEKTIKELAR